MDGGTHSITFIDMSGLNKDIGSNLLNSVTEQADSVYGWILQALRMTDETDAALSQAPRISVSAPSANVDTIKKLWELKEYGAISSVEYELEKSS